MSELVLQFVCAMRPPCECFVANKDCPNLALLDDSNTENSIYYNDLIIDHDKYNSMQTWLIDADNVSS